MEAEVIEITLRLAESNWTADSSHPHFQKIPNVSHIMLGHEDGSDIFVASPSNKPDKDWTSESAAFESKVGGLDRFPGPWEKSLMVRFPSQHRRRLLPFVSDLFDCGIEEVDDVFDRTMVEWRAFFSRWGAPLSPEEQRGLIGELLVLEEMLESGNPKVPASWKGPADSLHDFEADDWHVEVKTSMRMDPTAMIHPIEQLDPMEKPLSLVMVRLKRGEGMTLPGKISQLREHPSIKGSPDSASHFEEMLGEIGYDQSDDHHYSTTYSDEVEFTRLDVNSSESLLNSKTISSDAKYKDIRWILLASQHDFQACDSDFWKDPL